MPVACLCQEVLEAWTLVLAGVSWKLCAHSNSPVVINLSVPQFLQLQDRASSVPASSNRVSGKVTEQVQ